MSTTRTRWTQPRRAAFAAGLAIFFLGLCADLLHLGEPGFGERQLLLVGLGLLLILGCWFLWPAPRRESEDGETAGVRTGAWIGRAYTSLALLLLNSVVALLLANGLAFLGLQLTDRLGWTRRLDPELGSPLLQISLLRAAHQAAEHLGAGTPEVLRLSDRQLAAIYPGWSRSNVAALLAESRGRSLRFAPWTQFQEKPFAGTFFHVIEPGFRRGREAAIWPIDRRFHNVWVFGGSTTFGYGLPDGETIPSQLEGLLRTRFPGAPIRVYNFGQGYFYSGQELALFTALLTAGEGPPEIALFVDGINEHQSEPAFSATLRDLVRAPWTSFLRHHPGPSIGDGRAVVERWLRTKRAIEGVAGGYGVRTLFVWQPAPDWGYDLRYHPLWQEGGAVPRGAAPIDGSSPHYAAMADLRTHAPERLGENFLWLGDLQRGETRPLYVDRLHYTAAFARRVAEAIAPRLAATR